MELKLVQAMREHGEDPAVIFAFEKTLLWITENNLRDYLGRYNFKQRDRDRWNAAIEEYECLKG